MRSRSRAERRRRGALRRFGERGAITAEFATAMPAVILVLACCLAGAQVGTQQLRLQDAAATAVRSASRGEAPALVIDRARQLVPGASVTRTDRGGLTCITLTLREAAGPGFLAAITLRASGCALAEVG